MLSFLFSFFVKILCIYLKERESNSGEEQRESEKQAPSREPDMGVDPGSSGSHPGLNAALNH